MKFLGSVPHTSHNEIPAWFHRAGLEFSQQNQIQFFYNIELLIQEGVNLGQYCEKPYISNIGILYPMPDTC